MKYLKKFNESLDDDFDKLDDKNHDKAIKFINCLTDPKLKSEFKYRLTDGEDFIDLIEEFVDKVKLSDEDQFEFRLLVMSKRIEDNKSKYNDTELEMGLEILYTIREDDFTSTEAGKYILEFIKTVGKEAITNLLNVLISYLKDNNEVMNWTYERPNWNPNDDKIKKVKDFISKLKD